MSLDKKTAVFPTLSPSDICSWLKTVGISIRSEQITPSSGRFDRNLLGNILTCLLFRCLSICPFPSSFSSVDLHQKTDLFVFFKNLKESRFPGYKLISLPDLLKTDIPSDKVICLLSAHISFSEFRKSILDPEILSWLKSQPDLNSEAIYLREQFERLENKKNEFTLARMQMKPLLDELTSNTMNYQMECESLQGRMQAETDLILSFEDELAREKHVIEELRLMEEEELLFLRDCENLELYNTELEEMHAQEEELKIKIRENEKLIEDCLVSERLYSECFHYVDRYVNVSQTHMDHQRSNNRLLTELKQLKSRHPLLLQEINNLKMEIPHLEHVRDEKKKKDEETKARENEINHRISMLLQKRDAQYGRMLIAKQLYESEDDKSSLDVETRKILKVQETHKRENEHYDRLRALVPSVINECNLLCNRIVEESNEICERFGIRLTKKFKRMDISS